MPCTDAILVCNYSFPPSSLEGVILWEPCGQRLSPQFMWLFLFRKSVREGLGSAGQGRGRLARGVGMGRMVKRKTIIGG